MYQKKETERNYVNIRQMLAYSGNVSPENWEDLYLPISHCKLKDTINAKKANNNLPSYSLSLSQVLTHLILKKSYKLGF